MVLVVLYSWNTLHNNVKLMISDLSHSYLDGTLSFDHLGTDDFKFDHVKVMVALNFLLRKEIHLSFYNRGNYAIQVRRKHLPTSFL